MLIRLIPSASQPTVLFKLIFQNLPESLQAPAAWVNHLAALDSDDLEIPEFMHALDKAVGVQSILEEVTFDLNQQKIKCIFLDGEREEWDVSCCYQGLSDEPSHRRKADLYRRLDSVIDDVNESAAVMDRERKLEKQQREQRRLKEEEEEEAAKQAEALNNSSGRKNRPGHKKQRSLLMNLVSSLLPLSLNSPRSPRSPLAWSPSFSSTRSTSPAPSVSSSRSDVSSSQANSAPPTLSRSATIPTRPDARSHRSTSSLPSPLAAVELAFPVVIVAPPSPPPLSPRALRRRARSSLVDTFRLYVLPELNRRIRYSHLAGSPICSPVATYGTDTSAPYYTWIVGSTLKRVDLRLSEIGKELKDELDNLGIDLSTLPLGVLAGLGLASIANAESSLSPSRSLPRSLTSIFGARGDEDLASEGDSTDRMERHDGDNLSEVTLIDSNASSIETPITFHYHTGDPSNGNITLSAHALPPFMYLKTSSLSNTSTPTPIAHPEVHLPDGLNELLVQHNDYSSLHLRLAHLLLAHHTRSAAAAADVAQREAILEVRGRRRSWLNGVLKTHGSSGSDTNTFSVSWSGALASPFRPSGLGRYSYSSDEWECDPYNYLKAPRMAPSSTLVTEVYPSSFDHADHGFASHLSGSRWKKSGGPESNVSLFPVCENEEDTIYDSPGAVAVQKGGLGYRRYLEVDIDDDDDDDEDGEETDVDALVDVQFKEVEDDDDDDDLLPGPSRPFLHPRILDSAGKLRSTNIPSHTPIRPLDTRFSKVASDPFDNPAHDICTPLVLVATKNVSKRIKNETQAEALSDNISEVAFPE
ncbi:hypothetical protein F5878DRAFT_245406 [Lentinula raphanica]|uniref:Uncharacterized protein n=1 Tax=Lentinula raphanica TaxID=153919 RepID=A0AA38UK15_9AGAR|nr:hypothetical protein F5880DRAFT_1511810 [Lentinula raphanica]KAJ3843661.1 hypothetical protein F5878DRAFT_245406 [Lentinula raphanica]